MNIYQLSACFIYPPRSFSEFNDRLEACETEGNFLALKAATLNHKQEASYDKFSCKQVLEIIRFPLQAYTDVNDTQIQRWKGCMTRLFPSQTRSQQDHNIFKLFCDNIKNFALPSLVTDPRTSMRFADGIDILDNFTQHLKRDPAERLEIAMTFNHKPKTPQERAKKLQVILNLMVMEQEFMVPYYHSAMVYLKGAQFQNLYRQKRQVIPIDFHTETTVSLENEYNVDDPKTIALSLQISETAFQIARKKNPGNSQELKDIIDKLKSLSQVAGNEGSRIEALINFIKCELLYNDTKKLKQKCVDLFQKLFASPLLSAKTEEDRNAEDIATPFVSWMLRKEQKIQQIQMEMLTGKISTTLPTYGGVSIHNDFQEIFDFCQRWHTLGEAQQKLYLAAHNELQTLINKQERNKKEWFGYKKILFGDGIQLPPALTLKTVSTIEELTPCYEAFFGAPKAKVQEDDYTPVIPVPKVKIFPKKTVNGSSSSHPVEEIPVPVEEQEPLPGNEPPFLYDRRVLRWHEQNVDKALDLESFEEEYVKTGPTYQRLMIDYHSFSCLADRFYDIGITQPRFNPLTGNLDTQYFVAAEIKRSNEPVKRGVIIWVVDKDNLCYHKFFHEKETRVVIKSMLEHTFYQVDFPVLELPKKGNAVQAKKIQVESESLEIDPYLGYVTITNERLDLKLTLYRSSLYL